MLEKLSGRVGKVSCLTSTKIESVMKRVARKGSRVITDGLSYWPPALSRFEHCPSVLGSGPAASEKLPWVHILLANVKGILRGVHHGVHHGVRYLQPYLSEFCWRFSRRHFVTELFDRLLCAWLDCGPHPAGALGLAA